MAAVVRPDEITVEPLKAMVLVESVSTILAALNVLIVAKPSELVTVTVFNAVVWPVLFKIIAPVASKVRF